MTISAQPSLIWYWFIFYFFPKINLTFFILFPLIFFIGFVILLFSAIFVSKIFLSVINLIHKPKEGVFKKSKMDKDYCYWSLRAIARKWPLWLARQLNLPYFEKIALRILGVKLSNFSSLHGGWVDCEFVEAGSGVKIGQGSVVMSNLIVKDILIIRRTVLKDNVIIGAHSVVLPGTVIEANTILDSISLTKVNQHLESNSIYSGIPAIKLAKNVKIKNIESAQELIFKKISEQNYDETMLRAIPHELSVPYLFYIIAGWIIMGCSFILPAFLFVCLLYGYLIPHLFTVPFTLEYFLEPRTILTLLLTPLIVITIYLLHLFFIALITRFFYKYSDIRGPAEGLFDRNLSETSKALDYYHARAFLLKYPVFAVLRSPFPWVLNWELKFIGSNKIGKGTVL